LVKREYYSLTVAAEKFGLDIEDLLHLAISEKIKLIALVAGMEGIFHEANQSIQTGAEFLIPDRYGFIPRNIIEEYESARINRQAYFLKRVEIPDDSGDLWLLKSKNTFLMTDETIFVLTNDINKLLKQEPKNILDGPHISEELRILIEAADRFWSNADPDEKDTHPTNKKIEEWLKKQGFSDICAQQGAVIIRPEWGAKGRRSGK
jgi:hypothetical protein